MKIIGLLILMITAFFAKSQSNKNSQIDQNRFYCSGWLFNFPDTVQVFEDYATIPKLTKYSVVQIDEKGYYNLYCWTGQPGLETPTEVKEKLFIKFKDESIIFKLGKRYISLIKKKGD